MFTGLVGPVEVFFYWPKAVFRNFYWPGAIGPLLASSPERTDYLVDILQAKADFHYLFLGEMLIRYHPETCI